MADPAAASNSQPNMVNATSTTITIDTTDAEQTNQEDTVQLKLRKPSGERKVKWSTETVDNEHMQKKKSKCCCIYNKPRSIFESSSEESSDSDDDANCQHHHQHGNKKKKPDEEGAGDNADDDDGEEEVFAGSKED